MSSYEDLFDYFKEQRLRLLQTLEELPDEELTRRRGLSFDNIKDVLVHTIMVEDNWLHHRAIGMRQHYNQV